MCQSIPSVCRHKLNKQKRLHGKDKSRKDQKQLVSAYQSKSKRLTEDKMNVIQNMRPDAVLKAFWAEIVFLAPGDIMLDVAYMESVK